MKRHLIPIVVLFAFSTCAFAAPQNIARGRPYTLSKAPNYALCTDDGDTTDLTDGKRTDNKEATFWGTKMCVGWAGGGVQITVDLGKVQPIAGAAFHTAAGSSSVAWPSVIDLLVSKDGETWHHAGDLITLSDGRLPPAYGEYDVVNFATTRLRTKGRYLRFDCKPVGAFLFVDEVEVYRGDDVDLDRPYPESDDAPVDAALQLTQRGVYLRIRRDLEAVEAMLGDRANADHAARHNFDEVDRLRRELAKMRWPTQVDGFKAIVPLNNLHASVFRVHANILRSAGHGGLTIWHTPPYRLLSPFVRPDGQMPPLTIAMMNGERRAEVINLTNGEPRTMTVRFRVEDLPAGIVKPHQVEYVDTRESRVVHTALVPLEAENGEYTTFVPPGMTRQLWLACEPRDLDAGDHRGHVVLRSQKLEKSVDLTLAISPVRFPRQADLDFAMWDYVANSVYGVSDSNRAALTEAINSDPLFNCVWANGGSIPRPKSVDADGNVHNIDFSRWDTYVRQFPGKKRYMIYAAYHLGGHYYSQTPGSDAFNRAVGQLGAAWAKHNREVLGLKPGQATILFIDEPGNAEWFQATWLWSKALRAGTDDIDVFNDPSGHHLEEDFGGKLVDESDIICHTVSHFELASDTIKARLRNLQGEGKQLWFYMCSGPTRHFDTTYYRLQPWYCFMNNATGSGFWAYGDTGGAGSSWNGYPSVGVASYTPVYIDEHGVTTTKHWEAAREGIMDYQYLVMLRRRVDGLRDRMPKDVFTKYESLLSGKPRQVIDSVIGDAGQYYSLVLGDQYLHAEDARLEILRSLIRLSSK